ncbi:helix-turn-helix domain-containing protein [Streptomyces paromomycinus]|uniref:XRE family transcriptional regulator n=1 Tax=Streptomyces paromomycinus TaxID=92743 RepID=A0A401VXE8_STREY|nr:helix-turn-helix domain-containing protein [Streptomyces paromomycinus]GCD41747.1 XRE family transcriptional regulator [Streptomyces paromomycinus]
MRLSDDAAQNFAVPAGLWEREDARRALCDRDIGTVLRFVRRHTGASQTRIGSLVGLAQSDVSDIERGLRQVQSLSVLTRIAEGLHIPLALLGITDSPATVMRASSPPKTPDEETRLTLAAQAQEDDVRRRTMMASAVGIGASLMTGTTAASASPRDPAAALEQALLNPPAAQPVPYEQLATVLAAARDDFAAAHYAALGQMLPQLIAAAEATRDAATGHARERAQVLVSRSYVLATELAVKQHADSAWATSVLALRAARASGDPVPIAEAARVTAITMRRAGRSPAAVDFLTRTATSLGAERGTPAPEALAARTCLMLTAAYTAASTSQRGTALDLLQEATETSARIPADGKPLGLFTIQASPAECAMYSISTHNALHTPDEGVRHVTSVIPTQLPTAERRARYFTDSARMWHQIGDSRRAYTALRAVEREAPEETRRPAIQALTADLLYSPRALPGLKEFARRTGAVAS